jgi:hypothetical protein
LGEEEEKKSQMLGKLASLYTCLRAVCGGVIGRISSPKSVIAQITAQISDFLDQ